MQAFSYVVRGVDGVLVRGTIDAQDAHAARSSLLQQYSDILHFESVSDDAGFVDDLYMYYPLIQTLRVYCGYLFALVFTLVAVGYPLIHRWHIKAPLLRQWVYSPLFHDVAVATFVFLLCTTLHRLLKGGAILAFLLTIAGLAGLGIFIQSGL